MDLYIFGGIGFLACILLARVINEKGLKKLSTEEKGRLVETFATVRKYQLIPIILILVVYFYAMKNYAEHIKLIFALYFVALIVMVSILNIIIYRKLKGAGTPEPYIKSYLLSEGIKTAGMFLFMLLLALNMPSK